jgi:hypothetical protein
MGWAGTHEFIDKSRIPNPLPAFEIHNNYNELHFNEKNEDGKVVHMVLFANCNWFFQGLIAVGGEYGIANGSCDKL